MSTVHPFRVLSVGTVEGFADDYAFFVGGLLDLFDVTQDPYWIEVADRLTKKQIDLFWDDKNGGFFSSSGTDSSVLLRMKEGAVCMFHCLQSRTNYS